MVDVPGLIAASGIALCSAQVPLGGIGHLQGHVPASPGPWKSNWGITRPTTEHLCIEGHCYFDGHPPVCVGESLWWQASVPKLKQDTAVGISSFPMTYVVRFS